MLEPTDLCLIGVPGSGKGLLADLCKPSGLTVRMHSTAVDPPRLLRGLPEARFYVRAYRPKAWATIQRRFRGYPRWEAEDPDAVAWAKQQFRDGWDVIDDALADRRHMTVWHDVVKNDPQAELDRIADFCGVPRWVAPDFDVYDNGDR